MGDRHHSLSVDDAGDAWVGRYERAWAERGPVDLTRFLPPPGHPQRKRVLAELVRRDQTRRGLPADGRAAAYYRRLLAGLVDERTLDDVLLAALPTMTAEPARREASAVTPPAFTGDDRFTVIRRIGEGGMGVVYEAYDRERRTRVAVKTLRKLDPPTLYHFKQEFRSVADLVHPNLVPLYELISDNDRWFFTMQLVDGGDLLSYARQRLATDAERAVPFDLRRLRSLLEQLVEGIRAIHATGKLHRDVKPSNILVRDDGRLVLLDFGLVAEAGVAPSAWKAPTLPDVSDGSGDRRLAGTLPYIAPEQLAGETLSPATDWYAVGVVLYEVLTGDLPYAGAADDIIQAKLFRKPPPPPSAQVAGVPEDLDELTVAMLQRSPDARPGAGEILRRLRAHPTPAAPARPPTHRPAPLVGRDAELGRLHAAYETMRAGGKVCVHVHGRSGTGKTTLVEHFLGETAAYPDVAVLSGRCYERESVPYKALDSLVDRLTEYLVRLPREAAAALLPRDVRALARLFPVLDHVPAIAEAPERRAPGRAPADLRREAVGALRELVARLGDRHPLVLSLDDVQWGDADSAELLSHLLRGPDPPRVLLLLCYRDEDAATSPFIRRLAEDESAETRDLPVDPLPAADARSLAAARLGETVHADRIAAEAGGNPYFIGELARHATAGTARVPPGEAGRLDAILISRVRQLPSEARAMLELVAVAGQPVRLGDVYRAASLPTADPEVVQWLRAERLVGSAGPRLDDPIETFHDRVRETVVAAMAAETRRTRHGQLAAALEASGDGHPETLAVHHREAGNHAAAAHHYEGAGDRAARALAFDRAATLYRQALALSPNPARFLYEKLGDALANAGRGPEAATAYQAASDAAPPKEALDLQGRAAFQYCITGHVDEGRAAFRRVLAAIGMRLPGRTTGLVSLLLDRTLLTVRGLGFRVRSPAELSPATLRRIDITRSVAVGISGLDPLTGAVFQAKNLIRALRAGEPYRVASALAWEAVHTSLTGGPVNRRADRLLDAARSLAERLDEPSVTGRHTLANGIAAFMKGEYERSLARTREAETVLRDQCTGLTWELDTARIFHMWSLLYMGELARLRERFVPLMEEAEERGDRYLATNLGTQVGMMAHLSRDRPEVGLALLRDVMGKWTHRELSVQHHNAVLAEVYHALYTGDVAGAWRTFHRNRPRYRASILLRVQHVRIDLLQIQAKSALALAERSSRPRARLREARRCPRRMDRERGPWGRALATLIRAGCAARAGDHGVARACLEAAASALDATAMPLHAAAARRRLGEVRGDEEGARTISAADAALRDRGVSDTPRMLGLLAPGFDG